MWGLHDYEDVFPHESKKGPFYLENFEQYANASLGKPRLWIGEAGVVLNDGVAVENTKLATLGEEGDFEAQTKAAEFFLTLHDAKAKGEHISRIDRIFYYSYYAPTEEEVEKQGKQEKGAFDSGLHETMPKDEGKGKSYGEARPAYCVFAYQSHLCPPTITRPPAGGSGDAVLVKIDTHGLRTEVRFYNKGKVNLVDTLGPGLLRPQELKGPSVACTGPFEDYAVAHNAGGEEPSGIEKGMSVCV